MLKSEMVYWAWLTARVCPRQTFVAEHADVFYKRRPAMLQVQPPHPIRAVTECRSATVQDP